jgi:glycosyltransferase involved in cell wall biosynthesis
VNIAIYTNPVAGGWSPEDSESWGGGEESIVGFARALARRGHEVVVYYDGNLAMDAPGPGHAVIYAPRGDALTRGGTFDLVIYFKSPEHAGLNLAPRQYVWTDQERGFDPAPFRAIATCSPYLSRFLQGMQPAMAPKLRTIPYGVDLVSLAADGAGVARDTNLVLHAASPDRGLEHLLAVWPSVVAEHPAARLVCTYGFDLFDKYGGAPALKSRLMQLLDAAGPSVRFRRYSRAETHALYYQAAVFAYYCTGGEQYGISLLKAQAAGCVPVVRPWGALHDTLQGGLRVETVDQFRDALLEALDGERQAELRAALAPAVQTWDAALDAWEAVWAEPDVIDTPLLPQIPPTPWNLIPQPGMAAPEACVQTLTGWAQAFGVRRPWVDPALGLTVNLPPGEGHDGWVVGWSLEDTLESPASLLAKLGIPNGARVLVLTSSGPWRAPQRRRLFGRRDLVDCFGRMEDLQTQATPLDGDGSAICATSMTWTGFVGQRDLARVRRTTRARETLSVCLITPPVFADAVLLRALRSVQPIADEVIVAINGDSEPVVEGAVVPTREIVDRFQHDSGIPCTAITARAPRFCWDCLREHPVGEIAPGHRLAGFETPRNQSLAPARGDWILWLDSDEQVCEPDRFTKYLRPNLFEGYGVPQDHHSSDPPQAFKRDTPVRLFRRHPDGTEPGWFDYGPHKWPTFHPGLTARFAGVVHEHPGHAPDYSAGLGPVLLLPDVWIAHSGYLTEPMRRGRFLRNWPLMVADRMKYPDRKLGLFLWLRDLAHQVRYLVEQAHGQVTPPVVALAEECIRLWEGNFLDAGDAFFGDCLGYVGTCYQVLGRGVECQVSVLVKKPEVSGEELVPVTFTGRVGDPAQIVQLVKTGLAGCERWSEPWM